MIILTICAIVFMLGAVLIAGFLSVVCLEAFKSYCGVSARFLSKVKRRVGVVVTGLSVLVSWFMLALSIVITAKLVIALSEMIVWFAND